MDALEREVLSGNLAQLSTTFLPSLNMTCYPLADDLGGSNVTANGTNGAELGRVLYKPWGETRFSTGTTPTSWRFTGQREDCRRRTIGLYFYNARYLDPQLGRFAQPDTIVPEPGNPQALNRYAYSFNNPLRFVDPNGHDPLDATWVAAFRAAHDGRDPTDADRLYRLYSLTYAGPISGSYSWSAADWQAANLNWNDVLQSTAGRESVEDFASAIGRLAEYYYDFETTEFVSGIALLFAGVAYNPGNFVAFVGQGFGVGGNGRFLAYANHGMGGFGEPFYSVVRGEPQENTHHYAGHLLSGFNIGNGANRLFTDLREVAQSSRTGLTVDIADVYMGYVAGEHGALLANGLSPKSLPGLILRDLRWSGGIGFTGSGRGSQRFR